MSVKEALALQKGEVVVYTSGRNSALVEGRAYEVVSCGQYRISKESFESLVAGSEYGNNGILCSNSQSNLNLTLADLVDSVDFKVSGR